MNVRKTDRQSDPRVLRSRSALGAALIGLLHERGFDDITVQDILDRAGVGRATFYSHYRNKQDVLHSAIEQLFVLLDGVLERSPTARMRLVPITEFLEHMLEAEAFLASLRASGRIEELWELTMAFVADMIRRRITPRDRAAALVPSTLLSRMLAAAFMEMLRWWFEQPTRETPQRMDATYHALANTILLRSRYGMRPVSPRR